MKDFIKNNIDNFNKLDEFIEKNDGNIWGVITSLELLEAIKEHEDTRINVDMVFYKNIQIIGNAYMSTNKIKFIKRKTDEEIIFHLPCICGIWDWEEHP